MQITKTKDIIQECNGRITIPEIRVWCHPEEGDDYYYIFQTFEEAIQYIVSHPEAENVPLIAFNGYEINIFRVGVEK